MRRILRKIAEKDLDNLGDISTLADPSAVKSLIAGRLSLRLASLNLLVKMRRICFIISGLNSRSS